MANSTITGQLTEIIVSQAQKEVTANANFRAASPANNFARNDITAAANLTWPYYGANITVDNGPAQIAAGTITNLPANRTISLEVGRVNAATTNITGISVAAAAIITVASHTFSIGDVGYISTGVVNMTQIQGTFFGVTAVTATTITTDINTSTGYTAYTSGGTISEVTGDSGVITVGKTTVFHTQQCFPLYTLVTGASTITSWTDFREPSMLGAYFNNFSRVGGRYALRVAGTSITGKSSALLDANEGAFTGSLITTYSNTATSSARHWGARSRGTVVAPLIVQAGDTLSSDSAYAFDGVDFALAGTTRILVEGTPAVDQMKGVFEVALSNNNQAPSTRLKVTNEAATFSMDKLIVDTAKTPASSTDTGVTGTICWDASYLYVCTATNTWTRVALAW